jgi:hypothetical protein
MFHFSCVEVLQLLMAKLLLIPKILYTPALVIRVPLGRITFVYNPKLSSASSCSL